MMLAGAMFLSCAVTAPSVTQAAIVHNVRLPEDVAAQMASNETPRLAVRFTDAPAHDLGWVLSSGMGGAATQIGVSRVWRTDDPAKPFRVRSGIATRVDADGLFDFKETMRGTCKLAHEENLK